MYVTFCVLKLLKFKLVRELQPENIYPMRVTFCVLKLLKFKLVRELQAQNISYMSVTFCVFKFSIPEIVVILLHPSNQKAVLVNSV